jgi:hypothetical protein
MNGVPNHHSWRRLWHVLVSDSALTGCRDSVALHDCEASACVPWPHLGGNGRLFQYQTMDEVRVGRSILVALFLVFLCCHDRCPQVQTGLALRTRWKDQSIHEVSSPADDPLAGGVFDGEVRTWITACKALQ